MSDASPKKHKVAIHWFRNGLRFHDNPCFLDACQNTASLLPLYVIDPDAPFAQTAGRRAGCIRANFVLESMREVDQKLRDKQSRLMVLLGKPEVVLPQVVATVRATALYYEREAAAPVREADAAVLEAIQERLKQGGDDEFKIEGYHTHTLHPMEHYAAHCKDHAAPSTYGGFTKIFHKLTVPEEVDDVTTVPPLPSSMELLKSKFESDLNIPTLDALGYDESELKNRTKAGIPFRGGEDAGVDLLNTMMKRTRWVCTFEKPQTSPNALSVDTTGLSPYVKHGCVSPRRFFHELSKVYATFPKEKLSKPPVSLHGQLMWREYNYLMGYLTGPNFDKMVGNPIARQIPWDDDPQLLAAWRDSQTGYPFIDAIMVQLKETGWIHHLARHAVACFLTRGDLWQSWEEGAAVFEERLIDADWSINNFNWQWLSCTAHFYQYFRCYSPIAFGKKTDPNGDYIRKWLPQFKDFPKKYIYEPWTAPISVQKSCGVIIGEDYPEPIVEHKTISKSNMGRMKEAYDAAKRNTTTASSSRGNNDRGGDSQGAKKRQKTSKKD